MADYPSIEITFLGTGTSSGVPMIACGCEVCTSTAPWDKRLRSSILVRSANTTLAVDSTPDFRYQMLRSNVKILNGILFTHSHKDHIAGLDDVRAYNYFMQEPMNVYATVATQEALKREFGYAFEEKRYPGIPDIILNTIDDQVFHVRDLSIIPIMVWHHKMPVWGFRFGDFTYITDANRLDGNEKEKIRGSKVLVINALRREPHISHFTLGEAMALAAELEIPQTYLTHISHQLGRHADVSAELPPGVALAYDGLIINL